MPLVVSELFDKVFDLVDAARRLDLSVAQLSRLSSQLSPEFALPVIHVPEGSWLVHGESFEGFSSAHRGYRARLFAGGLQLAA